MTDRYDPDAPILGTDLGTYRAVVQEWSHRRDLGRMPDAFGITPDRIALIVDDAEARGMFGHLDMGDGYGPTYGVLGPGRAFLNAVDRPRMAPHEARAVLEALLDRVDDLNADAGNPLTVERAWLYGSLATGGDDHGDVDVVVEFAEPPSSPREREAHFDGLVRIADAMGFGNEVADSDDEGATASAIVEAETVLGGDRDPRLSPSALTELQELGCPCRLVFDRAGGGRVHGPLLARHPGAGAYLRRREALVMPDMAAPPAAVPSGIALAAQRVASEVGSTADRDGIRGLGPLDQPSHLAYVPRLQAWLGEMPCPDGRHVSVVVDGRCFVDPYARDDGGVLAALGLERVIDGDGNVSATVTSAACFGGERPGNAQVTRLGAVVGQACAFDVVKTSVLGTGVDVPTAVLGAAPGVPEWVADVISAACGHLETMGLDHAVIEDETPSPRMA